MSPIEPIEPDDRPADGADPASPAADPVSDGVAPEGDDLEAGAAGGEPGVAADGPYAGDDDDAPVDPRDIRIAELQEALVAKDDQFRARAEAFERARHELERAKDRLEREHKRVLGEHKVEVVTSLLGVLDDFDRSLTAGAETGGEAFVEGVKMIRARLDEALGALGLSRFDAQGETFDPNRHEALSMQPVSDDELDGKVLHVAEAGAMVGEKVVRPARVIVGKKL